MNEPKPVLNRFFRIVIQDLPGNGPPEAFYSIKGLSISTPYTTAPYLPGGYDEPFNLPIACQTGTLILKRPLVKEKTNLTKWCEDALRSPTLKPTVAYIFILDYNENIVTQWSAKGIYPVGLESSPLGLEQGNGVIEETITLAYTSLTRT